MKLSRALGHTPGLGRDGFNTLYGFEPARVRIDDGPELDVKTTLARPDEHGLTLIVGYTAEAAELLRKDVSAFLAAPRELPVEVLFIPWHRVWDVTWLGLPGEEPEGEVAPSLQAELPLDESQDPDECPACAAQNGLCRACEARLGAIADYHEGTIQ